MERPRYGIPLVGYVIVLLGLVGFSCCVAAEFKKAKVKDLRIDGNICSLPRTPAFGLGVAALVCLSVAQIVGTSAIGSRLCSRDGKPSTGDPRVRPTVAITLLVLSWVSFGLAAILLGTGSSMSKGQTYREQGWLDNKCYLVKDGVYLGAAAMVVVTVILVLGFTITTRKRIHRTGPEEQINRDDSTEK